jgi:hypothetical protein
MKTTKSALDRVLTKLSAMRVTLSDEERGVLDEIVTGANDVEGHAAKPKAEERITGRANPKIQTKSSPALPGDDEVEGHGASATAATRKPVTRAQTKISTKSTPAAPDDDEVAAHSAHLGATPKPATRAQGRVTPRVEPAIPDDDEVEGHSMKTKSSVGRITERASTGKITLDNEKSTYRWTD